MVIETRKRGYSSTVSQMFACLTLGVFLCALYLYSRYPLPRKHLPSQKTADAQVSISPDLNATGQGQKHQINVNRAGVDELSLLPGIGPALAKEMILYRQTHGRFTNPKDLDKVPGIGPAKLAAIEPWVICTTQPDTTGIKQ